MNLHRFYRIYLAFAVSVTVLALVITFWRGLNLGIDFTGGTLLERAFSRPVSPQEVREVLAGPELADLNLGQSTVQPIGGTEGPARVVLIRARSLEQSELRRLDDALRKAFGSVEDRRTEIVGPVVGRELVAKAIWASVISAVLIAAYTAFRFEYRFAVATLFSLLHDISVSLAVLALTRQEVNTPFVAAILTVAGYSINDTIVIFDRIRENLRSRRGESLGELATRSINETLVRSLYTGLTTLFTIVALHFFGGATIRDFTLTLLVGIIAGGYSSIFVASPLWLAWRLLDERRQGLSRGAAGARA